MTKFGMATQVWEKHVYGVSATPPPHPKGAGPNVPKKIWDLLHACTQ